MLPGPHLACDGAGVSIAPWAFAHPPDHRQPQVVLVVFSTGPLSDAVPLDPERVGAPSAEALEQCAVRTIERALDPAWFDAWRTGALRAIAERDLDHDLAALDAADHAHLVVTELEDARDLTYLQAAWALVRYLLERGGSLVLDAHAMTFRTAPTAADAPLDVAREIRIVYETSPARPDGAHAIHTRGMRKFGAPDLVALVSDADVQLVGSAMGELADAVARGTELATPLHAVELGGARWFVVEDEHGLGELLQLENRARVIVDDQGHDLVGVMQRLRSRSASVS